MGNLKDFEAAQRTICTRFGAGYDPPSEGSNLGFAMQTRGHRPISGTRHLPHQGTNGWYIWCGEKTDDPRFFSSLHTEHLVERCPDAVPFLALPPGYGFIVDGDYIDVWFDKNFLVE